MNFWLPESQLPYAILQEPDISNWSCLGCRKTVASKVATFFLFESWILLDSTLWKNFKLPRISHTEVAISTTFSHQKLLNKKPDTNREGWRTWHPILIKSMTPLRLLLHISSPKIGNPF